MFDTFRRRKAEVLSHWYSLVPGFSTSPQAFYGAVENELKARQVPELELVRVEFHEGGPMSAKRIYLRLLRERFAFDVCAAPFGTAFYFSVRFVDIPVKITLVSLLSAILFLSLLLHLSVKFIGFFYGPPFWLFLVVFSVWVARNAMSLGLGRLDAGLLRMPFVGPIYERFIRRETYYREDTRIMFHDVVNAVVREEVERLTAANGIKLVRSHECSPLTEVYRDVPLTLPPNRV